MWTWLYCQTLLCELDMSLTEHDKFTTCCNFLEYVMCPSELIWAITAKGIVTFNIS